MRMGDDTMKENYQLKGASRKNPYAEKIKKYGYSVSIHYETPDCGCVFWNANDGSVSEQCSDDGVSG